jgi:excisionase family DNA binding protein
MTVEEAARYLRISRPTLYRWCEEGRVKFYETAGSRRFLREDLDAAVTPGRPGAPRRRGRPRKRPSLFDEPEPPPESPKPEPPEVSDGWERRS